MSEPIEFPLNFERYMEMGETALAEGLYAEAFLNFEEAYNLKEDIQANLALVNLLMGRSDFFQAKKIADEMRGDYLADSESFALYIKLLIGNQEFIKGRKLVLKRLFSQESQQALLTEIEQGESFFETFQQKERNQRIALIEPLAEVSFFQQAQILQQIEKLPQADYLGLAQEVISKANCHLLLRNGLLESLVELNVNQTVSIETLEAETMTVDLSRLGSVVAQESYQQAQTYLIQSLEKSESDLNRQLQEELRLQFTYLYPVADQLIKEPTLWVGVFLSDYLGIADSLEKASTTTVDFYQKLQAEIKRQNLAMTF